MAFVKLYVNVVNLPKQYGYLLDEWKEYRHQFRVTNLYQWVRYNVSHAEVFDFVGMQSAERQPCPFHKSDTGTSFQILMGNQDRGKTVKPYPRFICMNPLCKASKSWDTAEFLWWLYYPRLNREQV